MTRRSPQRLRNIGIVAHINAGKTTLTEGILYDAGKQRYMGEVDHGTAAMDWMPEEQERGISITAAVTNLPWRDTHINLIDTPGHLDFTVEVECCLRVLDGVVVVVDGVRGVESQTEMVWRQVSARKIPGLIFINKMDRDVADYEASLISLSDRLGCRTLPLVLPIRENGKLLALVDLITGEVRGELPAQVTDWSPSRQAVVEVCAEFDDSILRDYVDGREVAAARLHAALRLAVLHGGVVPVLAGSALCNMGVEWILDAVCNYLPEPAEADPLVAVGAELQGLADKVDADHLCGLVFKVQMDGDEELNFVRLYGGQLCQGSTLMASDSSLVHTVTGLWRMHAMHREDLDQAVAGDVIALQTDARLRTGVTIFAPGHPQRLQPPQFPRPVVTMSVEPESTTQAERLASLAQQLVSQDPSLELGRDPETGALLISGMGELHLEVVAQRLGAAVGHPLRLGQPRVLCCETVANTAEAEGECRRVLGEQELSVCARVRVQSCPGLGPAQLADLSVPDMETAGGDPSRLQQALQASLQTGLLHPLPAQDLRLHLLELSGDLAQEAMVEDAVSIACRKAILKGGAVTLYPYVDYEISCPVDAVSAILADMKGRGAEISQLDVGERSSSIRGQVGFAQVLGYATRLRSLSKGLAEVALRPSGFRPAP